MKRLAVIGAVLLQFLVLAVMAGQREYIVRYGKVVYLRTAPIDPRDMFRGDYVRLNYEISTPRAKALRGETFNRPVPKGTLVYAVLDEETGDIAGLAFLTDTKPDTGLFLRGRTTWPWSPGYPTGPTVRYGIEAYFVEQGKGQGIEKRRGQRTGIQIPLEMEVAVGGGGTAVIKGYRWSPVGIGLAMVSVPPRVPPGQPVPEGERKSAIVRLTLVNASDKPLALVNLPGGASFDFQPLGKKEWVLARSPATVPVPRDEDVIVLAPDARQDIEFDLGDPQWWVRDGDGPAVETGTLDWSERFRIVYRPLSEDACRGLKNRDLIWHGEIPSRAFHGRGQID